jgi:hypothetical protein
MAVTSIARPVAARPERAATARPPPAAAWSRPLLAGALAMAVGAVVAVVVTRLPLAIPAPLWSAAAAGLGLVVAGRATSLRRADAPRRASPATSGRPSTA